MAEVTTAAAKAVAVTAVEVTVEVTAVEVTAVEVTAVEVTVAARAAPALSLRQHKGARVMPCAQMGGATLNPLCRPQRARAAAPPL